MSHSFSLETPLEAQITEPGLSRLLLPMAAALGASATAAYKTGHRVTRLQHESQSPEGTSILFDRRLDCSIMTLVGHRVEAETLTDLLEPSFGKNANTVYFGYPKRDMTLKETGSALLAARRMLGRDKRVSLYFQSMGGKVGAELFSDESFCDAFGKIDQVVFDSSPSSIKDVRSGPKAALWTATHTKHWYTMNATARTFLEYRAKHGVRSYEGQPIFDTVLTHRLATAGMPLWAIAEQEPYLRPNPNINLRNMNAVDVHYVQAPRDNVIRTEQAAATINDWVGGRLQHHIDFQRPFKSHAAGAEYPQLVLELLNAA